MRRTDRPPFVLIKTDPELRWPEGESVFYLLSREGISICRSNEFFRSVVPTSCGPSRLESQCPLFEPTFPVIPRLLLEQVAGFFGRVADRHGAEAVVVLVWDRVERRVHAFAPPQVAIVAASTTGARGPIGLHYTMPIDLPSDWIPFGDIHSHAWLAAYSSKIDVEDEAHRAGLHMVLGRIDREPPDFHAEAVVDGVRFRLDPQDLVEGYLQRDEDFPTGWIDQVEIRTVAAGRTAT